MENFEQFDAEFNHISCDNRSGSVKVLNNLIKLIRKVLNAGEFSPGLARYLADQLRKVCAAHRDLKVFSTFEAGINQALKESGSSGDLEEWLSNYQRTWNESTASISRVLHSKVGLVGKTILLHSHSQTILDVLALGRENDYEVVQTESRPNLEGRDQALILSQRGVSVTLITDFSLAHHLPEVDLILLGADQFDGKAFINKMGSYSICLLGKHFRIPIYVLADSRKEVETVKVAVSHSANEVWPEAPSGIEVVNQYFEVVPLKLIEGLITESGLKA